MINIIAASTKQQFKDIASLANTIWREHYTPIIGIEQVDYMIEKYQSSGAMYVQFIDGYEYFMIYYQSELIGYFSMKKRKDSLFLSKIYIAKDFRGQGFGKQAMDFVSKQANNLKCKSVTLGVNKYNTNSIEAYKKMGFKIIGEMVTDIGNGFIMDDYKMEKII
jgi:ribosomal protein S18 acetylase RimI-like enzyme